MLCISPAKDFLKKNVPQKKLSILVGVFDFSLLTIDYSHYGFLNIKSTCFCRKSAYYIVSLMYEESGKSLTQTDTCFAAHFNNSNISGRQVYSV